MENQPLCINIDNNVNFELKSGFIHLLSTFNGLVGEDPHTHLKDFCCDVAVAQINYPSFKHNTQDSIEQARGRSHEEVSSQIFMLYVM